MRAGCCSWTLSEQADLICWAAGLAQARVLVVGHPEGQAEEISAVAPLDEFSETVKVVV